MAYQPYPYPGYQPGYYTPAVPDQLALLRQNQQLQNFQQPLPPQTPAQVAQQPVSGPSQNNGIIWVSGKGEADGYLVAPNSAVALWDANNPVIYLRQADSTGKPSTKVYDLVERTDNPSLQQAAPQIDLSQFVTREQLEDILAERLKKPARATTKKEDE